MLNSRYIICVIWKESFFLESYLIAFINVDNSMRNVLVFLFGRITSGARIIRALLIPFEKWMEKENTNHLR